MAPLSFAENSALRSIGNDDSSWLSYSPALAAILTASVCVSLWLIVIVCGCGKNEEADDGEKLDKKSAKKRGKKGVEKAEEENEAGGDEEGGGEEGGGEEEVEEEAAESTKDGISKKRSPKTAKKGKKSVKKGKKAPAVAESAVDQSGVEQSNIKPGMMSKTTAPSIATEMSKVPAKKSKKGFPQRGDPLYKTLVRADSQVFDKKKKGDEVDVPAGTMVDKTQVPGGTMMKTQVPGGTMMKTQVTKFGRTDVQIPQDTLAKARTEIFDKGTQKPAPTEVSVSQFGKMTKGK